MTYLTRISIDPTSRGAMPYLTNPHRTHGAIMKMFAPAPHGHSGDKRVIWRMDTFPSNTWLYIVSNDRPDASAFHAEAGVAGTEPLSREYGPNLDHVAPGNKYNFRLLGNTVKAAVDVGTPNGKRPELTRGKRVALIREADQLDWLARQGNAHGFSPLVETDGTPLVKIVASGNARFKREKSTLTIAGTVFAGGLRVDDPEKFRSALVSGIGRGKAYGVGLMTISALNR
ncbi:type I-E CRISPR-associated protein Cas6/Cse3/CasE [Paeniglutamicibacter cryotolerans]|uniref:CRISPR system Cascade subunit CasE n=1 Tax=Paeniglutamicibacter cryotolerans TaxID=670079 RepID=A0A839QZT4_9MICC|nr:type I-E CRISPR-associated protein Cas6/Cse3/CasE [Paeniglutamicibacter cryotolerans]MBB2997491.1 CRISPR system Cascade subunit CasE [Paeniglutamicibacter cryotolerans]